ncbi:hypothetical protein HNQ07_002677 [Deinococcus metalli]|uniref:Uncharacterized protein n=1 Tax=Deinococcus metalli TaxID=1141878 RepID=A0A7W8KIM2_9DEIO|nr:hypothetical protein [Deinococcus metalli]MBB5377204.1 hypothetical protein [Deinococcus metalli]GHF48200.1 hypothetical protein GCM10017781_25720 [Deinococcus metalli]
MTRSVAPRDLETAFHGWLKQTGLELEACEQTALFRALIAYFKDVRIERCSPGEHDYLHFESSGNTFYFERILYVPWELLYPADPEVDPDEDLREKWGVSVGPQLDAFASAPEFPTSNLWSNDYPSVDEFADAVLAHPAMTWADQAGPLPSSTFHDQIG